MGPKRWVLWLLLLLLAAMGAPNRAFADNRVIVRTTLGLQGLQQLCLLQNCTVATSMDGSLGQLFLVTTPLDAATLVQILLALPGITNAEVDVVLSLVGGLNQVPSPLPTGLLSDRTTVSYFGTTVWNAYATQPAAGVVQVQTAQTTFSVLGNGIAADIDTGVDPNHPALQGVLLPGYDFTRNQPGASEINDLSPSDFPVFPPPPCSSSTCPSPVAVNQSTVAILDQSSAAIVESNVKYAAFGHGTMVMGVIHLVAPQAKLLPLKAFHADGTGYLSDILRAVYYAVQNDAKILNMSFDFKTSSPDPELKAAIDYSNQLGIICAASAGNDGQQETVYPAGFTTTVMGVASTSDLDTRSSFSNYGPIVWVAAPGEAIITTYPFATYAAGWGTSFSAPFVSGGAGLLLSREAGLTHAQAATAIAHAKPLDPSLGLGNGRLDLVLALQSLTPPTTSDFALSAAPASASVPAGRSASFTVSVTPIGSFQGTVALACSGQPATATCTISPSQLTVDGTDPATATLTVMTVARTSGLPVVPRRFMPRIELPMLQFMCLTILVLICWFRCRPRWKLAVGTALLVPIALMCTSCNGGAAASANSVPASSAPTNPVPQGTAQGTYPITVTGTSGSTTHMTTITLTVN